MENTLRDNEGLAEVCQYASVQPKKKGSKILRGLAVFGLYLGGSLGGLVSGYEISQNVLYSPTTIPYSTMDPRRTNYERATIFTPVAGAIAVPFGIKALRSARKRQQR